MRLSQQPSYFIMSKSNIRTMEDLKNMKVPSDQVLNDIADYENVLMHANLGIPDDIFNEFDQKYHVKKMIRDLKYDIKRHQLLYVYRGVTWSSTVYNYYYGDQGDMQLMIKLSHNGFHYTPRKMIHGRIHWHNKFSFSILDPAVRKEMKYIDKLASELKCRVIVKYNIRDKMMYVRFKDINDKHILMISFHHGNPEFIPSSECYA
jgi:hypothetical protein